MGGIGLLTGSSRGLRFEDKARAASKVKMKKEKRRMERYILEGVL